MLLQQLGYGPRNCQHVNGRPGFGVWVSAAGTKLGQIVQRCTACDSGMFQIGWLFVFLNYVLGYQKKTRKKMKENRDFLIWLPRSTLGLNLSTYASGTYTIGLHIVI